MNFKFDAAVTNDLINKTEERTNEAVQAYADLNQLISSLSTSEWDDEKKKELETYSNELYQRMGNSLNQLNDYLLYLKKKVSEFQNI